MNCRGQTGLAAAVTPVEHPSAATDGVPHYDAQGRIESVAYFRPDGFMYAAHYYSYFDSGPMRTDNYAMYWSNGGARRNDGWDENGHPLYSSESDENGQIVTTFRYVGDLLHERWTSDDHFDATDSEYQYQYDAAGHLVLERGVARTNYTARYIYVCNTDFAVAKEIDSNEDGLVDSRQSLCQ